MLAVETSQGDRTIRKFLGNNKLSGHWRRSLVIGANIWKKIFS